MSKFTRSIVTTKINPVLVAFEDGKPVTTKLATITEVGGSLSEQQCSKIAETFFKNHIKSEKTKNPDYKPPAGGLVIESVEVSTQVYEMALDTFLKYATPKNPT